MLQLELLVCILDFANPADTVGFPGLAFVLVQGKVYLNFIQIGFILVM